MSQTASPLADRLGGGSGMFVKAADEEPKPALRRGPSTSGRGADGPRPMTQRQRELIDSLLKERKGVEGAEKVRADLNLARERGNLNTVVASKAIDDLFKVPKAKAEVVEQQSLLRRNRYAQACEACGKQVAVEAGWLDKSDEGKWVVFHEVCPSAFPFPEGRYAVDNEEGVLRFYHLTDGEVFVMASDNEHLISSAKSIKHIVDKIAEDPLEASKRYGKEFKRCGVCGRGLSNEESRKLGIGPVCITRL